MYSLQPINFLRNNFIFTFSYLFSALFITSCCFECIRWPLIAGYRMFARRAPYHSLGITSAPMFEEREVGRQAERKAPQFGIRLGHCYAFDLFSVSRTYPWCLSFCLSKISLFMCSNWNQQNFQLYVLIRKSRLYLMSLKPLRKNNGAFSIIDSLNRFLITLNPLSRTIQKRRKGT